MADVDATVQGFADSVDQATQGDWESAASSVAPVVEDAVQKAPKPKAAECAMAAAGGAATGAGTGAGIGSLILPVIGTVIGGLFGGFFGAVSAADAACGGGQLTRADLENVGVKVPPQKLFFRHFDVTGPVLRRGKDWTSSINGLEKRLDRFPIGKKGLTIGRMMYLMRRTRELGGGADEMARIVGLVAPKPTVQTSLQPWSELTAWKAYKDALAVADKFGATDPGKMQRNVLKRMQIAALMRGGFDRFEAEKKVLGKAQPMTFVGLAALRKLISDAEPQASYVGPLRSIFGRPAQPATTRATSVDTESSPALPLALGAAAVGAFYFLGK